MERMQAYGETKLIPQTLKPQLQLRHTEKDGRNREETWRDTGR